MAKTVDDSFLRRLIDYWDENAEGNRSAGQRQLGENTLSENDGGGCESVSYVLL